MTQFRDRSWEARLEGMGDLSEAKCLQVYGKNLVRFGLDRPPLQVHKLPVRVRYSPDFLGTNAFVECQGFGRDQTLKVKWEKLNALLFWNSVHPVELFAYDSHNDRWTVIPLRRVMEWIDQGRATLARFPENKAYFAFSADTVFAAA